MTTRFKYPRARPFIEPLAFSVSDSPQAIARDLGVVLDRLRELAGNTAGMRLAVEAGDVEEMERRVEELRRLT